ARAIVLVTELPIVVVVETFVPPNVFWPAPLWTEMPIRLSSCNLGLLGSTPIWLPCTRFRDGPPVPAIDTPADVFKPMRLRSLETVLDIVAPIVEPVVVLTPPIMLDVAPFSIKTPTPFGCAASVRSTPMSLPRTLFCLAPAPLILIPAVVLD